MPGRDELFKGDLNKILQGARVIAPEEMRPVTKRHTTVQLIADIHCVTVTQDDSNICAGYLLRFTDQAEGVTYLYQFDQTLMDVLNEWVNSVPRVGDEVPSD